MLTDFLGLLESQQPHVVSFFGTALGILAGFCTLVAGALFNSHLNRRRDDRLRKIEAVALAGSLRVELFTIRRSLQSNADGLMEKRGDYANIPDPGALSEIYRGAYSRLGLLDQRVINVLLNTYGTLDSLFYGLALQGGRLDKIGQRQFAVIATANHEWAAKNILQVIPDVDGALSTLDEFILRR